MSISNPVQHPFLETYNRRASGVDELVDANGQVRPHWDFFYKALQAMGPGNIAMRQEEIYRFIRENGVTYNVYGEQGGRERPWPLDVVPVLMDSREWAGVENGLIQRAELLDLILQDLYGPGHLIRDGLLPPEVVFGHDGFLRPCRGLLPGKRYLHFYAANMVRGADGRFMVLSDRLQSPSGSGYAVENRIVLSRILPSLYRDSHVHRLALFFRTMRNNLAALAGGAGRLILLTPGPENETYFEQAFLANYLGLNLVEGSDLTVRDGRVHMKTLKGLVPVDGILRRIDDAFVDPLELKGDSVLGAAGMLNCIRAGTVTVLNPPGTGVVENPGIFPFLPEICRRLLGQDLRVNSVPTHWGGNSLDFILQNLNRLVIKPLARGRERGTLYGSQLSFDQQETLRARLRAKPWNFVAQEEVQISTTPLWQGDHFEARPMVIRTYATARDDSFLLMPGGLVRVSPDANSFDVSNQKGGVSKDLWILASEPEKQVTLLSSPAGQGRLLRSSGEIQPRVADNLFWIGRYAERSEGLARILREIYARTADAQGDEESFAVLFTLLEPHTALLQFPSSELERTLLRILTDATMIGGMRFNAAALTTAGRALRDRLSEDAWRTLNRIEAELGRQGSTAPEMIENVLMYLASFAGFVSESMTRGQGFRFLELGRRIERALVGIDLLRAASHEDVSENVLESLLRIQNSSMTYRRRYRHRIDRASVVDLLVFDESNPRALLHQLLLMEIFTRELPERVEGKPPENRLVVQALASMRLAEDPVRADPGRIGEVCRQQKDYLLSLSAMITTRYLSYLETQQRLEGSEWPGIG